MMGGGYGARWAPREARNERRRSEQGADNERTGSSSVGRSSAAASASVVGVVCGWRRWRWRLPAAAPTFAPRRAPSPPPACRPCAPSRLVPPRRRRAPSPAVLAPARAAASLPPCFFLPAPLASWSVAVRVRVWCRVAVVACPAARCSGRQAGGATERGAGLVRSEEHTSELQSR